MIVFSVLFALLINNWFESHKTKVRKEEALKSIQSELLRNMEIVEGWKEHHGAMHKRILAVANGKNEDIYEELMASNYFDIGLFTDQQPLVDVFLAKTAWESAKTTGIVSAFDYESIQQLTVAYDMQEVFMERTLNKMIEIYFTPETHDKERLDRTLLQLSLLSTELTGQEQTLHYLYGQALAKLGE